MGLHCSDTFMATAGIIHGNDGPKTDGFSGGGSGVDFVKEGEERMEEERRRGKDHPRRQFPMRDGCDGIGSSRRAKSRNPGLHSTLPSQEGRSRESDFNETDVSERTAVLP